VPPSKTFTLLIFVLFIYFPYIWWRGWGAAAVGYIVKSALDFCLISRYHHDAGCLSKGVGKSITASIYHPIHNEAGKSNIINKSSNGTRSNGKLQQKA